MLDEGDVVVDVEKATRLTITVYVGSLMYQISGGKKCIHATWYSLFKWTSLLDIFAAVADLSGASCFTIFGRMSLPYLVIWDCYLYLIWSLVDFVDKRCDVRLTKQENEHWPVLHKDIPLIVTFTRRKNSGK